MYREIKSSDLVGKTIRGITNQGVNCVEIRFTDDTSITLWAEQAISTSVGDIPGIFVDDPSLKDSR